MAFTFTVSGKSVHGNQRVVFGVLTADGAAGAADVTGGAAIDFAQVTPKSATSGAYKVRVNARESGTAAVGFVAVSGVASGDEFFVAVYGK